MREKRFSFRNVGSIVLVMLLLAFKCADLHELTHDKGDRSDCQICLLAHSQIHTDEFTAPTAVVFEPTFFIEPAEVPVLQTSQIYVPATYSGIFLNKAPPVV